MPRDPVFVLLKAKHAPFLVHKKVYLKFKIPGFGPFTQVYSPVYTCFHLPSGRVDGPLRFALGVQKSLFFFKGFIILPQETYDYVPFFL